MPQTNSIKLSFPGGFLYKNREPQTNQAYLRLQFALYEGLSKCRFWLGESQVSWRTGILLVLGGISASDLKTTLYVALSTAVT